MVNIDMMLGKVMRNLWLTPIIGAALILIQSIINFINIRDAIVGICIGIIVIISAILSRKDVYGSGAALLLCAFFLILSPIGYSGYDIGLLLIILGTLFMASGGFFTMGNFFFYVALGAIITDLILFFI